jgi:hypothetical protein
MVVNFVTASVGLLNSIALIGLQRQPLLAVDIPPRSSAEPGGSDISFAAAEALVLGSRESLAGSAPALAPLVMWPREITTPPRRLWRA